MNEQKRLGEVKVSRLSLEFSSPVIIGMIVNTLYNIIDRMFIGHIPGVGNLAIACIITIIVFFTVARGLLSGKSKSISINDENLIKV